MLESGTDKPGVNSRGLGFPNAPFTTVGSFSAGGPPIKIPCL